jgi:hypothetical protein
LESIVVKPTRPRRQEPQQSWWQPGLCASVPAVMLWIVARLPAGILDGAVGGHPLPVLLNHIGDTLFVAGWLASGLWLWLGRRHPAAAPRAAEAGSPAPPSTATPAGTPGPHPGAQ